MNRFLPAFGLSLGVLLSAVASTGCGQVTYVLQQYDGPVRAKDQVSILRVQPGDPAQIIGMDGEKLGPQMLDSDVRLHIEMLPGKHELNVENPQAMPGMNTKEVKFVAEPGRTYRVVLADRAWHVKNAAANKPGSWSPLIYEVQSSDGKLLREVSLPPSGS